MARVRLFAYDSDGKKWEFTGLQGKVQVVKEGRRTAMQLLDEQLLFETELYYGFALNYTCFSPCFHYFPLECGTLGLSFCSDTEASEFHLSLQHFSPAPECAVPPRKHTFASNLSHSSETSNGLWDTQKEKFNVDLVPKGLKRVFRQAGIKKNELSRRQTAIAVFEGLVQQQIEDLMQDEEEKKDPVDQSEDIDTELDRQIKQIAHKRKQTVHDTQSQILQNIENGMVVPTAQTEEQRLARLLARKIEERRKALHVYDSSGDSSSESDWSDSD